MKTFLKVIGGLFLFAVLVVAAAYYFTGDLKSTANDFFAAVKANNTAKATEYLSQDFRSSTSPAELSAFLDRTGLSRFQKISWGGRQFSGTRGFVEATVTTEQGGAIPLKIQLVKEGGAWRINAIEKPASGLTGESVAPVFPSGGDLDELVRQSMHEFALAVNEGNFSRFHHQVAGMWQRQASVEDFNQAFRYFIQNKIDLTPLDNMMPIFDHQPVTGDDGIVSVLGHYATKPVPVTFDLGYVHEGVGWKLVNVTVRIKPAS